MKLHASLPALNWTIVNQITSAEAERLTIGNTEKFKDRDYLVINSSVLHNNEIEMPIGTQAVYLRGDKWWLVEKLRY